MSVVVHSMSPVNCKNEDLDDIGLTDDIHQTYHRRCGMFPLGQPLLFFDYEKFLHEKFKNPVHMTAFLRAYGVRHLNAPAVEKWFQRKRVPSEHLALLLALVELETGAPV